MKKITIYRILAYFFLSLCGAVCIYIVYQYISGAGIHTDLLLKMLFGLACGLGLLAEVRRLKEETDEGEESQ